jgi:AhpD family alkylhydroperoxidase
MKTLKKINSVSTLIKRIIFILPLVLISITLSAQDNNAYENAKKEIIEQYGVFPSYFDAYPEHALAGAWENFKQLESPESNISPKNRELLKLAVASQIPCIYCIYYHKLAAKSLGATDEEINEAVALGAQTRQWSMITQGAEIDFEDYKKETNNIIKYMSEKSKK